MHGSCDQNEGDHYNVDDMKCFVLALSKEENSRKNDKHSRASYYADDVFSQEKLVEIYNPCPLKNRQLSYDGRRDKRRGRLQALGDLQQRALQQCDSLYKLLGHNLLPDERS